MELLASRVDTRPIAVHILVYTVMEDAMAKYDRLAEHLSGLDRARKHTLSFERIESILGSSLPHSARTYQAWWANQKNGRHSQANAWLGEGWVTEDLSLDTCSITFAASATPRAPRAATKPGFSIDAAKRGVAIHYGVRPDQVDITIRG